MGSVHLAYSAHTPLAWLLQGLLPGVIFLELKYQKLFKKNFGGICHQGTFFSKLHVVTTLNMTKNKRGCKENWAEMIPLKKYSSFSITYTLNKTNKKAIDDQYDDDEEDV